MGHYDSCREGYCGSCGAAPGNFVNGKCQFCHPQKPEEGERRAADYEDIMIRKANVSGTTTLGEIAQIAADEALFKARSKGVAVAQAAGDDHKSAWPFDIQSDG